MRTYKYFGISKFNGERKLRASSSENYGALIKSLGHTAVKVVDIAPDSELRLTKLEGAQLLLNHPEFQDLASLIVIEDYIKQHSPKPKGKPGRPRKEVSTVESQKEPTEGSAEPVRVIDDPLLAAAAAMAQRERAVEEALEAA
jgi:hypothetical protein